MTGFISELAGMIILGVLSAALSYYNRNYFIRVVDDILGREEEENTEAKLGRGFIYGFLFPVYFFLVAFGLIILVAFLIVAGILAGIAFLLVWLTEKIIPKEPVGAIVKGLFDKVGIKGPSLPVEPAASPAVPAPAASPAVSPVSTATTPSVTTPPAPVVTETVAATEKKEDAPAAGGAPEHPNPEGGDSTPTS